MSITISDIEHIAMLARISLTEEEKTQYMGQLNVIFDMMEQLEEVDTSDVEETCQVTGLEDVVREDIVIDYPEEDKQALREQFPDKLGALLKVARVFNR
ncbi:MAG: Asp-tRNA(Asn)/Glu-tRNA(Gln) amidotransferase subunit GatC [Candidatus Magasanikbacteria bacterium]|nr:Asp-tRNA(Asn)/Glu-tRNA(Gln) amidotransferase subunit GatC [Candidatus Magasanikbacteria bacterium]MBT4071766.1 Asp-tRNA(Asn)/Glu-tRNA(Gln) amidotransferase subunit GatC [Candidatus Magasanikbacteria bacterium]